MYGLFYSDIEIVRIEIKRILNFHLKILQKKIGVAGDRSLDLIHAKHTLYH